MRPFLNIDAGELPEEPEALFALAHVVNIACGGHAGDQASMARALERCGRLGARPGAHPSYEDREHFGRRRLEVPPEAVRRQVKEQCRRLAALAALASQRIEHVKPHGALYHAAAQEPALGAAVVEGAMEALGRAITVLGPPSGALREQAERAGAAYAPEGFADRGTRLDGSLIPRGQPGAVLEDPAAARARAVRLAVSGTVSTLCVHGDTPGAEAVAREVRRALDASPAALGDGAIRFELPPGLDRRAVLHALRALPGAVDAVVTGRHAALCFDPDREPPDPLAALDAAGASPLPAPQTHLIRVRYDGADLEEVARRAGRPRSEVIALHAGREYQVEVMGFMPGFAYLGELPAPLQLPRLPSPRRRVPARAVAIAGRHTGLYPFESPGGWNLIGTALDFTPFSPERGAAWRLGDRVRFLPEGP